MPRGVIHLTRSSAENTRDTSGKIKRGLSRIYEKLLITDFSEYKVLISNLGGIRSAKTEKIANHETSK